MRSAKPSALFSLVLLAFPLVSLGQDPHAGHDMSAMTANIGYVPSSVLEVPTTLKPPSEVGRLHDPATTSSSDAQKFYDQGEAYLHSYVWIEAARSFNQALRLDPKMAMAYVGLSRVYSNLNDESSAENAVAKAREFASGVSEKDRTRIELEAKRVEATRT